MKTILVIDRADNCAYDCFLASEDLFGRIYPGEGQDVEFIEDVLAREGERLDEEFKAMWRRPVRKTDVRGDRRRPVLRAAPQEALLPKQAGRGLGREWTCV